MEDKINMEDKIVENSIEKEFDHYLRLNRLGFICANCSCGVVVEYAIRAVKYIRGLEGNDYRNLSKILINGSNSFWIFYFFGEVWAWDSETLPPALEGIAGATDYRLTHKYKFLVIYGLAKIYDKLNDEDKKKVFAKECYKFLKDIALDEDRLIRIISHDMCRCYNRRDQKLNTTNILKFGQQVKFEEIPNSSILNLDAEKTEDQEYISEIYRVSPNYTKKFLECFKANFDEIIIDESILERVQSLENFLEKVDIQEQFDNYDNAKSPNVVSNKITINKNNSSEDEEKSNSSDEVEKSNPSKGQCR